MDAEIVSIVWPAIEFSKPSEETLHLVHTTGCETSEDLARVVNGVVSKHPDCTFRRLRITVAADPAVLMGSLCRIESLAGFPENVAAIQLEHDDETT